MSKCSHSHTDLILLITWNLLYCWSNSNVSFMWLELIGDLRPVFIPCLAWNTVMSGWVLLIVAWMLSKLQNRHSTIDSSCAIDLFFYSMFFLNLWSKLPYWTITWVLKAWLCYDSLNFKEFYSLQLNEEAQAKNMLKLFYVRALFCNNHTEVGSDNLCETMNVGRW